MKLLALDCSTTACSVALLDDSGGEVVVSEKLEMAARQHTQRALLMVESILHEQGLNLSQLDGIAFGRGPGSFTGIRICVSVVQGLAYGADLPVLGISTLEAQAKQLSEQQAEGSYRILSTLDARMEEVYWATYQVDDGKLQPLQQESLSSPELVTVDNPETVIGIGSGHHYLSRIPSASEYFQWQADIAPAAAAIVKLAYPQFLAGAGVAAALAAPVYLRDQVAWQKPANTLVYT